MKLAQFVLTILLLVDFAAGQQFSCPTQSAGCSSYEELLKAKDQAVASTDVRYVCFRDYSDEFFLIKASEPLLLSFQWWKWNPTSAAYLVNPGAQSREVYLGAETFSKGVEDDSRIPYILSMGKWVLGFGENLQYYGSARHIDSKTGKWVPNQDATASVDDSQVLIAMKYEAQSEKKVEYSLAIQRSTKRFHESFNVIGDPKAGFENTGRCVEVNPMPKLPDRPTLTQEQIDAQDKSDLCSDYTKLSESEKGYCMSSFVYQEDYEASLKKKSPQKTAKQ
jgi:hypothetical protein